MPARWSWLRAERFKKRPCAIGIEGVHHIVAQPDSEDEVQSGVALRRGIAEGLPATAKTRLRVGGSFEAIENRPAPHAS